MRSLFAAMQKSPASESIAAGNARRFIAALPVFAGGVFFAAVSLPASFLKKIFCRVSFGLNLMAFFGHFVPQSKQSTHLEKSDDFAFASMHCALHSRSHMPHEMHDGLSSVILNAENLASRPSQAPTGHIVLQ